MSNIDKRYTLGIDIGTTSVKMSVYDYLGKEIIAKQSLMYQFDGNGSEMLPPNYSQQNTATLIATIQRCLSHIPISFRSNIRLIGICGQMHGCVLWHMESAWEYHNKELAYTVNYSKTSDLYTWKDSRCSKEFIESLPKPDSSINYISTGFGCATIFWLQKHEPETIKSFDYGGTIMDFLVAMLCHIKPVMSTHNAMSWGYFNAVTHSWNEERLKSFDFPMRFLPHVQKPGSFAGVTKNNWLGIDSNTPVMVALGDMQCSCFANIREEPDSAVLSISTSMQMSFLMPRDAEVPKEKSQQKYKSVDYYPYFNDQYLAVAASLNGGNVLHELVKVIEKIVNQFTDVSTSQDTIWDRLIQLGLDLENDRSINTVSPQLSVQPTLFGERHDSDLRASISNINCGIEIGEIMSSTCRGLIDNIFDMIPIEMMIQFGVRKLIGTGNALIRNPILKNALETKLNAVIPVLYMEGNDADAGAAFAASFYYHRHNSEL